MPLYEVAVSRIFVVKIEAQSKQEAAGLAPFYLGFKDSSEEYDRALFDFEFKDIKMVENELIQVEKVED